MPIAPSLPKIVCRLYDSACLQKELVQVTNGIWCLRELYLPLPDGELKQDAIFLREEEMKTLREYLHGVQL